MFRPFMQLFSICYANCFTPVDFFQWSQSLPPPNLTKVVATRNVVCVSCAANDIFFVSRRELSGVACLWFRRAWIWIPNLAFEIQTVLTEEKVKNTRTIVSILHRPANNSTPTGSLEFWQKTYCKRREDTPRVLTNLRTDEYIDWR